MLIGLVGAAGSGKTTAANYLSSKYDIKQYALADPIKEIANALFGWNHEHSDGVFKDVKVLVDCLHIRDFHRALEMHELPVYIDKHDISVLALYIDKLTRGATPNVFTPRRAYQVLGTDVGRNFFGSEVWANKIPDNVIVTDVRYPNEAQAIKDKGGHTIKIIGSFRDTVAEHDSEKHVDSIKTDYVINNDITLTELFEPLERVFADIRSK